MSSLFAVLWLCFGAVLIGCLSVFYLNEYESLPTWFKLLHFLFAVLLCLVDVVIDAICRGLCIYLQPFAKIAAVVGTSALIMQLHLPEAFCAAPMSVLAGFALLGGILCARWASQQEQIGGVVKKVIFVYAMSYLIVLFCRLCLPLT